MPTAHKAGNHNNTFQAKKEQLQNTKVKTENGDQAKTTIKVIISLTISENQKQE